MEHLGNEHFVLATDTRGLSPASIVYSVGVGTDASWDVDLINKFGCMVHTFDPTPRSVAWVKAQTLPPQFVFHPYGLAHFDGTMRFYDPPNPNNVSFSPVRPNKTYEDLPVKRLSTIMQELGHDHIDLLKVDVEGGEFDLIGELAAAPVTQLIIEFHSRFFRFGSVKRWFAIRRLTHAGFVLFYQHGNDWSFIRR